MDSFQIAGRVEDIVPGTARIVQVNGKAIALFNVEGRFYAISNTCPHEGGPLGEGRLKGCVVTCPWHDLAFDVRTGHGTDGGGYCVGSYEVRIQDKEVFIGGRRKP
jgi:nitrite reductase/ring-hydroxylating ferredoxin subunit